MNDQTAIELINRSLSEPLSDQEQTQLHQYLSHSPQSMAYFELSQQIQKTIVEQAKNEIESGPGLSQLARSRIAKRLASEMMTMQLDQRQEPESFRRVAENNTDYQAGPKINDSTDNSDSTDNGESTNDRSQPEN